MEVIHDCQGIPVHDQRLMYGDKCLFEWDTLADHQVEEDARIELFMGQTGGGGSGVGIEFADVSNTTGLKRKKWSRSAPHWRCAAPGLCLEGICKNKNCPAFEKQVIMNLHFTSFDLTHDNFGCLCPICYQEVTPTTCGFSNCRWKWVGRKIDQKI